jgi:hypothetical protein
MPIMTGCDYQRDIRLQRQSNKAPVDLTGFDLELCVKAQRGDGQALLVLALGDGLAIADPTAGVVTLDMSCDHTDAIGAGDRVWGLYRIDGARRLPLATGKMHVQQGI